MNKNVTKIFKSRIISAALFFGLAGAIWGGWDLYGSTPPADYPLTIIGAFMLGILGGLGLALPSGNKKQIIKVATFGLIGSVLGFIAAWLGIYNLPIVGSFIFLVFTPDFALLTKLEPSLAISVYWLNFTLVGTFIGLFFALGLKRKILPMVLRGAIAFGLAAIIGPVIGNLIGNLFNILLINYILTFVVICVIFGVCLSVDMSRKQLRTSGAP